MREAVKNNLEPGYELGEENGEIIRIPTWLCGEDTGLNMTEFSRRFEEMVNNVAKTVTEVEKTKLQIQSLDHRINGSMDAIEKHICEAVIWHRAILTIAVMVVFQIIGFVYIFGMLTERVQNVVKQIEQQGATQNNLSNRIINMRDEIYRVDKSHLDFRKGGNYERVD
jgi:cell division protein FtsB